METLSSVQMEALLRAVLGSTPSAQDLFRVHAATQELGVLVKLQFNGDGIAAYLLPDNPVGVKFSEDAKEGFLVALAQYIRGETGTRPPHYGRTFGVLVPAAHAIGIGAELLEKIGLTLPMGKHS